jgi:hypothetical protein
MVDLKPVPVAALDTLPIVVALKRLHPQRLPARGRA